MTEALQSDSEIYQYSQIPAEAGGEAMGVGNGECSAVHELGAVILRAYMSGQLAEATKAHLAEEVGKLAKQYGYIPLRGSDVIDVGGRPAGARQQPITSVRGTGKSEAATEVVPEVPRDIRVETGSGAVIQDIDRYICSQAAKHPLLTREQEVGLAKAMKAGRQASYRLDVIEKQDDPIDDATKEMLAEIAARGAAARERMINSNMQLVVWWARKYRNQGLSFADLVQEGAGAGLGASGEGVASGLMHAVDMYDHTRGYKFSTYAHSWIQQAMMRAIANHSRAIRLPEDVQRSIRQIRSERNEFYATNKRLATEREIAGQLGLKEAEVAGLAQYEKNYWNGQYSLEMPVSESGNLTLGDSLASVVSGVESGLNGIGVVEQVGLHAAIGKLSGRQRYVVNMTFGFNSDQQPHDEREIAQQLGCTVPVVRQALKAALAALREEMGDGYNIA